MQVPMPDLTVIVCTYNRRALIESALESLLHQTLDPRRFEILVVDNASTDGTAEAVRAFQDQHAAANIRYLFEPRQGLGYSRNTGWRAAMGRFVAYLDDDARAEEHWLERALNLLESPEGWLCVGGPIYPFYTSPRLVWFQDRYEVHTWGDSPRPLQPGESLSGSNMTWRKEALEQAGGFGEDLGVSGDKLSVGEETIVFRRLWRSGNEPRFYYTPELLVYHWVAPYKMSVKYYLKRYFVTGQEAVRQDRQPGLAWRLRTAVRSLGAVLLRGVTALILLPRYPHWQNWAVEETRPAISKLGAFLAAMGIWITVRQK